MTVNTTDRARQLDPIEVYVGSQIRLRRKLLGISQGQLAEQLGITFQQLQKYEKGTNRIGAGRLFRIARILNVEISHLFPKPTADQSESAQPLSTEELPNILTSSEAVDLNHAFARIGDANVRRRLVGLIKCIADSSR